MIKPLNVASVEMLVTFADGSAYSLATTQFSHIDMCTIGVERADPSKNIWESLDRHWSPPIVQLSVKVDGSDIKYIMQYHPAPEEP